MNLIKRAVSGIASPGVVLFIFFLLYISFPSGSSSTDGWNYAAIIKYSGNLFHPFHLLYNQLGYLFCIIPVKLGCDVLAALKVMNSLFAILALLSLQIIIRTINIGSLNATIITFLAGSSFAFMRYATENETYIVPLSLALLSSLFFLKYSFSAKGRYAVLSGLMASLAVLFHLTYIFWWLILLIGFTRPFKRVNLLAYLAVSLIIPVTYILAVLDTSSIVNYTSVRQFFMEEATGNIALGLTSKGIILTLINLFRSFVQLHGYMIYLVRDNLLMTLPAIASVSIAISALFCLPDLRRNRLTPGFARLHILIVSVNLLFALLSFGNAEYMVMIPCLTFMLMIVFTVNNEKFFLRLAAAMLIWNIGYGLLPLSEVSEDPGRYLVNKSYDSNNLIIGSDDQLLISINYYETGNSKSPNIIKSPALQKAKGLDLKILESTIDSALLEGRTIYTDCLGGKVFSRASFIAGDADEKFFSAYEIIRVKEWQTRRGPAVISRITGRKKEVN